MSFDFNNADNQNSGFELIPAGTIAPVVLHIKPGGEGEEGLLTQSQKSDAVYLMAEMTILQGPYATRRLWDNIGIDGGARDDADNSKFGNIGRAKLRAILESARNVSPTDFSQAAAEKRRVNGFGDFEGLEFTVEIGVQPAKDGYDAKNTIKKIITPDMKGYTKVSDASTPPMPTQTQAKHSVVPDWAK